LNNNEQAINQKLQQEMVQTQKTATKNIKFRKNTTNIHHKQKHNLQQSREPHKHTIYTKRNTTPKQGTTIQPTQKKQQKD
jgi:hypothetical protein